jgi:hypothetical protein
MSRAGLFPLALAAATAAQLVSCVPPSRPSHDAVASLPAPWPTSRTLREGSVTVVAAPSDAFVAQFDTLWTRFNDVYPSFTYKGVDWIAQRTHYRPRAERARSQAELVAILAEMLAPLRDLHVWFVDPRGQVVPTFRPIVVPNFDADRWEAALRDANYTARVPGAGDGALGAFAYLYIGTWKSPVDNTVLDAMLHRARDAQGLIIDLRTNAGGTDATALTFASRFAVRPFAASYVEIRTDPRVRDVEMPLARTIAPRGPWQFTRPVVVITGRAGFSATETFVAAMRTMPHVTVIGDTTGGASGNPATFPLGNGWHFTVPRWMEFGPDRQPIEGRGVAPHFTLAWPGSLYDRGRDPLIDAAVGMLGERTGVYRMGADLTDEPARATEPRERGPADRMPR